MASVLAAAALFAGGLAALLLSSQVFTDAVERIGLSLGVSPFIVGATIVAGGTSLPELSSSVVAMLEGEPGIVTGNVVGSNVANIFLVLGVVAVVGGRVHVDRELERVDLPLLVASTVFLVVAVWGDPFRWYEGVLALVALAIYTHFTLSTDRRLDEVAEELVEEHVPGEEDPPRAELEAAAAGAEAGVRTYLLAAASLVVLAGAAEVLVSAIVTLAAAAGVDPALVALTAVGVGTSLPEVAVSATAVRRGSAEIAVGNVLGSNIFNALAVPGVASFVGPVAVPASVRSYALPVLVLATVLYYFVTQDRDITRWEGGSLLLLYAVFLANLVRFV